MRRCEKKNEAEGNKKRRHFEKSKIGGDKIEKYSQKIDLFIFSEVMNADTNSVEIYIGV